MANARLLIITGAPCSGKSTLAALLRTELRWPLLAKDAYKEALFDSLGIGDRAWSKRLSDAAYALMFQSAGELLASGCSCILEGNFRWFEQQARFAALERAHRETRRLQLFCNAPDEVLLRRYRERCETAPRHPGHVDAEAANDVEAEFAEPRMPLPLAGTTLIFDSCRRDAIARLREEVRAWASL
jgi:predicted kinase